jgi:hypothetical protein
MRRRKWKFGLMSMICALGQKQKSLDDELNLMNSRILLNQKKYLVFTSLEKFSISLGKPDDLISKSLGVKDMLWGKV